MRDRKDPTEHFLDLDNPGGELPPAEEPAEPCPEPEAAPPAGVPEIPAAKSALATLQAEKDDLRKTLIRLQADFENFRKRIERERHEDHQRATARFVDTMLPVLDAFERALAAHTEAAYDDYRRGFELIFRQMRDALARMGLERIEAAGKRFDPHVHQAVERVETTEHEDGTVIEELQSGYALRGRVLRPAMVRVAVHPAEGKAEATHQVN